MKTFRLIALTLMSCAMLCLSQPVMSQYPGCDEPVEAGLYDMGKMWTFDYPPSEYFQATYNFKADQKWFDEARLSSLRFADYCSASFVSADGLVMTNHHCSRESGVAIQKKGEDVLENGFYAARLSDERKVEGLFVDQLVMIEDITVMINDAISGIDGDFQKLAATENAFAAIKKEYSQKEGWKGLELETIRFYDGGKYSLYGFKRYTDVRLVFMPEAQIAYFGGDYDNFTYPRYNLDCSFFRVYDNDKPLKTDHYFKYNVKGATEGEAVFIIGNPGSTSRMSTIADLEFYRDRQLPFTIDILDGVSKMYQEFNKTAKSDSLENLIFSLENSLKVYRGELKSLKDPCTIARKAAFEAKFRNDAANNASLLRDTAIWSEIRQLNNIRKEIYDEVNLLTAGSSFITGQLMQYASGAVNIAIAYPDTTGTGEIRAAIAAPVEESELATEKDAFSMYLEEAYNKLGPDHPFVVSALNGKSPEDAADDILKRTKLADDEFRKSLLSMDSAAIWKVNDPMIDLARIAYIRGYDIAMLYQSVEARLYSDRGKLGNMLFTTYGTRIPPDATFSLRINDGVMTGYEYNGTIAPVNTTFYGLYERYHAFGKKFPYSLPSRWENIPDEVLKTPLNFVTTNDIIGGNSGSPMINKELQVVGLAFDGNIESLSGNYIFLPEANRAIGVHSSGIIGALKHVYRAKRLVTELEGR